jgi:hypothetical protein
LASVLLSIHKIPKLEWALRLVPLLCGKALEAFSRLPDEDSRNYDEIKTDILSRVLTLYYNLPLTVLLQLNQQTLQNHYLSLRVLTNALENQLIEQQILQRIVLQSQGSQQRVDIKQGKFGLCIQTQHEHTVDFTVPFAKHISLV